MKGNTKIRVICSDPDATDSSSDENDERLVFRPKRVVHEIFLRHSNAHINPTQIETPLPTTNRYVGVKRTGCGTWGAQIKDPFSKKRLWLGTYDTPEEASNAYISKKQEFVRKKTTLKNKHIVSTQSSTDSSHVSSTSVYRAHDKHICGIESVSSSASSNNIVKVNPVEVVEDQVRTTVKGYKEDKWNAKKLEFESPLIEATEKTSKQPIIANEYESKRDLTLETIKEGLLMGQVWSASCREGKNSGLDFGSGIIDNNGFLLGEFSMLDDLRICDVENDKETHHNF